LTGKEQYELVEKELGIKCVNDPDVLLKPEIVCLVAGWYWNKKNLNTLADKSKFLPIVKAINGGYNGIDERIKIYESILDNGLML
jgi:putative chitinase